MTVTVLLQYREHTAFLQHAEDLAPSTGDDEVAAFFTRELNELFQCADCRSIQIAGVAHAQHDNGQTGILGNAGNLFSEQICGAEKEVAFHVHNGNLGQAFGFVVELHQGAFVVEGVFHKLRTSCLAQE